MAIQAFSEIEIKDIKHLSTGEKELDRVFSDEGIPCETLSILYGGSGVGKSRFVMLLSSFLLKQGYRVLFHQMEMSPSFLKSKYGSFIDSNNFFISTASSVFELEQDIRVSKADFIINDSINILPEYKEGKNANEIHNILRKCVIKNNCHIMFLCQQNVDGSIKGGTKIVHMIDIEMKLSHFNKQRKTILLETKKNRMCEHRKAYFRHEKSQLVLVKDSTTKDTTTEVLKTNNIDKQEDSSTVALIILAVIVICMIVLTFL